MRKSGKSVLCLMLASVVSAGTAIAAFGESFSRAPNESVTYNTVIADSGISKSSEMTKYFSDGSHESVIDDYIYVDDDGVLTSVYLTADSDGGKVIYTERYDESFNVISKKELLFELDRFGGFFAGQKYNYLVFGQDNKSESDSAEVIRIVKYDKQFNRISHGSVADCFTIVPFDFGTLRMAEYGSTLAIHTTRKRYLTEDGLNHQSQLTIFFDTEKMAVINELGRYQKNHVSHSFSQYILHNGTSWVTLDLGDAYPRSVTLNRINDDLDTGVDSVDLLEIPGTVGDNYTGIYIGGFGMSDENYIAAMNIVTRDLGVKKSDSGYLDRDVVLLVKKTDALSFSGCSEINLTDYKGKGKTASAPRLVRLDGNRFIVLWEEYSYDAVTYETEDAGLCYAIIDGSGSILDSRYGISDAELPSECQPILWNDSIIWYVDKIYQSEGYEWDSENYSFVRTNATYQRIFYQLDLTPEFDRIVFNIGSKEIYSLGKYMTIDVEPEIINGRTMLPARYVAESLGASVEWNEEKKQVVVSDGRTTMVMTVGSDVVTINGKDTVCDSVPVIVNSRLFTPVRLIAEAFGAEVRWKPVTKTVIIYKKQL